MPFLYKRDESFNLQYRSEEGHRGDCNGIDREERDSLASPGRRQEMNGAERAPPCKRRETAAEALEAITVGANRGGAAHAGDRRRQIKAHRGVPTVAGGSHRRGPVASQRRGRAWREVASSPATAAAWT